MGTAVQYGDEIIVTNKHGSVRRSFRGVLISYQDGVLTYIPHNASKCSTYVGI